MSQEKPPRITLTYLWREFLGAFNWDKGFMYTVKALALRPGAAIRNYLREDRSRYFNPVRFLVLTVAVSTLLLTELAVFEQSGIFTEEVSSENAIKFRETFYTFFTQYLNIFQLVTVPVFALLSWLFFRRQGYNYAEHLTMNAYVFGESTLLYILFIPVVYYSANIYLAITVASIVYYQWAYVSFFGGKRWSVFFKSMVAIGLSYLVFTSVLIGAVIAYLSLSADG